MRCGRAVSRALEIRFAHATKRGKISRRADPVQPTIPNAAEQYSDCERGRTREKGQGSSGGVRSSTYSEHYFCPIGQETCLK